MYQLGFVDNSNYGVIMCNSACNSNQGEVLNVVVKCPPMSTSELIPSFIRDVTEFKSSINNMSTVHTKQSSHIYNKRELSDLYTSDNTVVRTVCCVRGNNNNGGNQVDDLSVVTFHMDVPFNIDIASSTTTTTTTTSLPPSDLTIRLLNSNLVQCTDYWTSWLKTLHSIPAKKMECNCFLDYCDGTPQELSSFRKVVVEESDMVPPVPLTTCDPAKNQECIMNTVIEFTRGKLLINSIGPLHRSAVYDQLRQCSSYSYYLYRCICGPPISTSIILNPAPSSIATTVHVWSLANGSHKRRRGMVMSGLLSMSTSVTCIYYYYYIYKQNTHPAMTRDSLPSVESITPFHISKYIYASLNTIVHMCVHDIQTLFHSSYKQLSLWLQHMYTIQWTK